MKKLFLIVLLVCMCVGAVYVNSVLAEVKFGNWDKWDEQLPPKNSKSWHWVWPSQKTMEWIIKDFGESGNDIDIIVLCSDLYYGRKFDMKAVSVIFYSSGDVSVNDWNISNSTFALAAFPPKKGKMVIRAYQNGEAGFKFFEEWEIAYEIFKVVVPEVVVPQGKFRQTFKEWLKSLGTICFEYEDMLLPNVLVSDKNFVISNTELYIKK